MEIPADCQRTTLKMTYKCVATVSIWSSFAEVFNTIRCNLTVVSCGRSIWRIKVVNLKEGQKKREENESVDSACTPHRSFVHFSYRTAIEEVYSTTFLRIHLDSSLTWRGHVA